MKTNVTELPDSRVRVDVEVDAAEVDAKVKQTAERLGGEMKLDGFRKGKVPAAMVLQRVGRPTVLNEALESSLGGWYESAMLDAEVSAVGDPKLEMSEMPDEGQPLKFSVEVAVRPGAELGEYKGLEVGRAETEVPADAVNEELERLREGFARLNPVERAAGDGDVVLMDYVGEIDGEAFEGGSAKDYLLELGAGRVLPELEEAVVGSNPGEEKVATVNFPDDYHGEDVAGKTAPSSRSTCARSARRSSPTSTTTSRPRPRSSRRSTSCASRSPFESRTSSRSRPRSASARRRSTPPSRTPPSRSRTRSSSPARAEMWERVERRLREQGMDPDAYLQMQGKTRDELIAEARPDASRALKREAVLEAVAEAEQIEISEDEKLDALQIPPGHEDHGHPEPADALAELRSSGREGLLEADLRMRRALETISENAKPIPLDQAEAREEIWTPEKEREQKGGLWKPGDPE